MVDLLGFHLNILKEGSVLSVTIIIIIIIIMAIIIIIIIIIRIVDVMQFGSATTHSDNDLDRVDLSLASHSESLTG